MFDMENDVNFEFISTNGIKLHTAMSGPEEGEPVILLHGYPDAWFGWMAQIIALSKAGFRVVAPDQRGYNLSDKPEGVNSYAMDTLVKDIIGLADSLGFERFHLAGHDFGGLVSWRLVTMHPERVKSLAILNVSHPEVMNQYLRKHISQIIKSWYAFFYQLPALPEYLMRANNWRFLISAMAKGLSEAQRNRYREAWAQPGAITSMINWYRALFRRMGFKKDKASLIEVPTLMLWGKQDPHISYAMVQPSLDRCLNSRLVTFENASHWVMADEPDEVSQCLIEHFRNEAGV
jgi:pimeloyl-ACP methyl ester carboxylesterase